MANINNIQELARKLNLQNMAKPNFELCETDMSNLDYLEYGLEKEIRIRNEKLALRHLRESKLPKEELDFAALNESTKWQIEQLINNGFTDERNLVVTGSCRTGKTSIASFIGAEAIKKGLKAYYIKQDLLIEILKYKNDDLKSNSIWNRLRASDVIIFDEIFYTNLSDSELSLLYKALVFLDETRKLVFVTNRNLSEWISASGDKHLIQTLIDRLLSDAEILRTNK